MLANGGEIDGRRFFTAETIHSDDDDTRLWHGSRLSNPDRVFCRLHERPAGNCAANLRSVICLPSDIREPAAATLSPIRRTNLRLPTS